TDAPGWDTSMPVLLTLVYAMLVVLYYVLMEGYLGQTAGKMLLGIKVIRENTGEVPGPGAAAIRTLLRIVDGLFSYLVAFIAVLATEKRQRLGDMAARTLVVRK
ncbi:MAG TPA: RDD family protein, partial [Rubrobacteraceae bacterium]|nr:RDD family protein [Rubrobacteraceae bacterium]